MGDFEKDLRNAFEGAEFTPSPKVWDGVKAGLAPKKKAGVFYMWQTYGVAAAILFLFTMGFLFRDQLFTSGTEGPGTELAESSQNDPEKGGNKSTASDQITQTDPASVDSLKENTQSTQSLINNRQLQASDRVTVSISDITDNTANSEENTQPPARVMAARQGDQQFETQLLDQLQQANAVPVDEQLSIYLSSPQDLQESIAELKLRWELENMVGPLEIDTTNIIDSPETLVASRTSLSGSFGGGNFNPDSNFAGGGVDNALSQENIASDPNAGDFSVRSGSEESENQLGSISVGVGIGFEIGRKWILRTGLRYSQYRYATTANAYVDDGQVVPVFNNRLASLASVRYAGDYELTNTIHSISIPVQMGYKLLDRNRFGVVLNAGLGADYFTRYTVKGELNFLETTKVDLDESAFRNRLNINVLTGLELNYKLTEKFALSGEVFFRQYIPSLGQTDGIDESTPSFFGFGLGINYYLRRKE